MLAYTVDAERAEIILRTAYLDGDVDERTDVIFAGVVAYDFGHDNFKTILFDIAEVELGWFYKHERERFERVASQGWPALNSQSPQQWMEAARDAGVRAFEIHSSYGLDGWVWARSMETRAA